MSTKKGLVAVVIPVEGKATAIDWSEDTLDPFYTAIGCDVVQVLPLHAHNLSMWVDEDARVKERRPPVNLRASSLARLEILGTVIVTPMDEEGGFTPEAAEFWLDAMRLDWLDD